MRRFLPVVAALCLSASLLCAADVAVRDIQGLRAAVAEAKPGTRIVLAPGEYGGGHYFKNLRGEAGRPIVIAAADPKQPPVFADAQVGTHLSAPAHVELHNLTFTRLSANGVNIDDGSQDKSGAGAHHVVLRGLKITEIGRGNHDGGPQTCEWRQPSPEVG